MQVNLKMFGSAMLILSIPILIALPQSFLASDVSLRQEPQGDRPGPDVDRQGPNSDRQGPNSDRRMPLFGKITAVREGALEVQTANGETVVVKLTGQTEFRKDRQAAKRSDFKVGDVIAVRGQENPDHSWT